MQDFFGVNSDDGRTHDEHHQQHHGRPHHDNDAIRYQNGMGDFPGHHMGMGSAWY